MSSNPRIYPSLPEYTPFSTNVYVRPSQNLPLPPRIYPPFQQLYATLPECTPPSQNIPPFSTTIILCDPPRIYPSLPEYTPLCNNYNIMRPSQNIPLLPRISPLFQQIYMCDPPRIYPPPSQNIPPFQQLYATIPETTHPLRKKHPSFLTTIWPPSLSEYIPRPLSTIFQESTPQSLNMPPFLETTCNCERINHSLQELKNILGVRGRFWEGRKVL